MSLNIQESKEGYHIEAELPGVKKEDVAAIIEEHLLGGNPVERLKVPAEVWG